MANNNLIYLDDKGLHVPIKNEIKERIKNIAIECFGSDLVYDEGTEFDIFLDSLSDCLKVFADATKQVFNSIGLNTAVGVSLDNLSSLAMLRRKIYEDGSLESDAKLRYRLSNSILNVSSNNKKSLCSKLNSIGGVIHSDVVENDSSEYKDIKLKQAVNSSSSEILGSALLPHSILVFTYCGDISYDTQVGERTLKYEICKTIFENKTLGCNTNGVQVEEADFDNNGIVNTIRFSPVLKSSIKLNIVLKFNDITITDIAKQSIKEELKNNIVKFINDLNPHTNIQYYDILNCVFSVYSSRGINAKQFVISSIVAYKDDTLVPNFTTNDIELYYDEKAVIAEDDCVVS